MCDVCDKKKPHFKKFLFESVQIEIQRWYDWGKEKNKDKPFNKKGTQLLLQNNPAFYEEYTQEEIDEMFQQINDIMFSKFYNKFIQR